MPEVKTFYLEMLSPDQLNKKQQPIGFDVHEAQIKNYRFNRFLYELIGEAWQWVDKLTLSNDAWRSYAESESVRTWVAYFKGSIAGYYELQKQPEGNIEVAYFGLASDFIGKGFGSYLLTHAISSAWAWEGTSRIWVHTCTLDHPSALANYQARGFKVYKTDIEIT